MSDWLIQFTSSFASSIAYGIFVLILSFLIKPLFLSIYRWIKRLLKTRRSKQQSKIIYPTPRDVQRLATKQKVTESEWKNAIAFLKNDIRPLFNHFERPELLGDKILSYLGKNIHIYQFILVGLGLINLAAYILHSLIWQIVSQIMFATTFLLFVLALVFAFISILVYRNQEKSKFEKIKSQMRDAITLLAPGIVFTYGELGEFLKPIKEHELPGLQSELSDIGIPINLSDMKFAHFLATAPSEKLLPIGEQIAVKATPTKQFADLSSEQKKEISQIFVDTLRLWPISLQTESGTGKK